MRQPLPQRVGGFGGVGGLAAYLTQHCVTHLIDATHPFAVRMSRNAVAACAQAGVPLIALSRAPWVETEGDRWTHVPDIASAVRALDRPKTSVLLAVGRMHLTEFAPNPQHRYVLRLVDPPKVPPPFPEHEVVVDRGPFSVEGDIALMLAHDIKLVVSKNSGGTGAAAKIIAARQLGLPVIMIARPPQPDRREAYGVEDVLRLINHAGTDLGV